MNTKELLAERGKTHGDFTEHARITQLLKDVMRNNGLDGLNSVQIEALEMTAHKIGRILAGDPNHRDHWDDIAGYATLVSERLPGPISSLQDLLSPEEIEEIKRPTNAPINLDKEIPF